MSLSKFKFKLLFFVVLESVCQYLVIFIPFNIRSVLFEFWVLHLIASKCPKISYAFFLKSKDFFSKIINSRSVFSNDDGISLNLTELDMNLHELLFLIIICVYFSLNLTSVFGFFCSKTKVLTRARFMQTISLKKEGSTQKHDHFPTRGALSRKTKAIFPPLIISAWKIANNSNAVIKREADMGNDFYSSLWRTENAQRHFS